MLHGPRLTLAALFAVLLCGAAHAGRPLQTDDAGVLDQGSCELEVALGRERNAEAHVAWGRAQPSCGIGFQSQLGVFFGSAKEGDGRADLAGLVGKTWLRQLTDEQTGVTIGWATGWQRPRGSAVAFEGAEVRGIVTLPAGPWLFHANLGWAHNATGHRDSTIWGLAAERTGLGAFDAMFEFFGDDREKPWANAGVRWHAVPERLFIDGSYGRQSGPDGRTLVTVGMKLAF